MSSGSGIKSRIGASAWNMRLRKRVSHVWRAHVYYGRRVRRVLKENPGTYNAPRTDDELEERKGERERERERLEGLRRKKKETEQTAKGGCFRCDRCSATPSCRHPWTSTRSPVSLLFRTLPSHRKTLLYLTFAFPVTVSRTNQSF